jgi:hypothetical protein
MFWKWPELQLRGEAIVRDPQLRRDHAGHRLC